MPTYEFRCTNGHAFELFHRKISDAPSTALCPQCGAESERMISGGAGLLFKGSGFYLTDYGKNAHRGGAKPDAKGDGKPAGESAGGAKTDGAGASGGASGASGSGGAGGGAGGATGGATGGGTSGGSAKGDG